MDSAYLIRASPGLVASKIACEPWYTASNCCCSAASPPLSIFYGVLPRAFLQELAKSLSAIQSSCARNDWSSKCRFNGNQFLRFLASPIIPTHLSDFDALVDIELFRPVFARHEELRLRLLELPGACGSVDEEGRITVGPAWQSPKRNQASTLFSAYGY